MKETPLFGMRGLSSAAWHSIKFDSVRKIVRAMRRDPSKQITAVAIGTRRGKVRPVLLVNGDTPLIIERDGLTEAQAVLVDGYVDGLRSGSDLDEDLIEAFLEDPRAVHRLKTAVCHERV